MSLVARYALSRLSRLLFDAWLPACRSGLENISPRSECTEFRVLTRDIPGYLITPHTDTRWKGITVQLYLPKDDTNTDIGTIFHEKLPDGSMPKKAQMRFAPNSGYAFAVGDDTWHSADPVHNRVKTRDSNSADLFCRPGPAEEFCATVANGLAISFSTKFANGFSAQKILERWRLLRTGAMFASVCFLRVKRQGRIGLHHPRLPARTFGRHSSIDWYSQCHCMSPSPAATTHTKVRHSSPPRLALGRRWIRQKLRRPRELSGASSTSMLGRGNNTAGR